MKRLTLIQQRLRIAKENEGDGGRFKYRTAEGILEAVKPLLGETEMSVLLSDSVVEVGGRVFLKASASLWGAEGLAAEAFGFAELDPHLTNAGKKSMSNEQCTGSASSYARKYALCGLFAIDNSEADPDSLAKSLITRIAEATTEDDINELIPEVKEAKDVEINKAFNAQVANLGLEYDKEEKKYKLKQQEQ